MRRLSALAVFLVLISCNKDMNLETGEPDQNQTKLSTVGKKLENPYSLKNMNRALINLLKSKGIDPEEEVGPDEPPIPPDCDCEPMLLEPTHTYVRVIPSDSAHYDVLIKDTTIAMFDYPLDVEISEGENVQAGELAPNGFKYLYTKVGIMENPPLLADAEVIDSLYVPFDDGAPEDPEIPLDENGNITTKSGTKINFYDILDESMRITGHKEKEITTKGLFGSKWNPSTTVRAWDNQLNRFVPLARAKVRARHFLHWDTRYTDQNGYAQFERFTSSVNYSIVWEQNGWDIRDGKLWQAYYNGPKQKSHWSLDIRGGKSGHYAMIHRACVRYFFEDIGGLKRPYNISSSNLKIAYLDENKNGVNGFFAPWTTAFSFLRNITLYSTVNSQRRTEFEIFSTAIHEIAHYAHCLHMGNIQYPQVSNNIGESWARAVQWHLANTEYSTHGHVLLPGIVNILNVQDWSSTTSNKQYSPLFIDLVDNFNQSTVSTDRPNDNVTGYSMSQLNNILMKGYGLASLKSELKANKPNGVTDQQIDQLFLRYEQLM